MITKVHMEALSPTMEEGQLVQWLKSEGDEVSNGDVLAEIETDKATMELVARGDGVLRKVLLEEGGTAPVGDVIAVIADADEDISEVAGGGGGGSADSGKDADNEGGDDEEDDDEEDEEEEAEEEEGDEDSGQEKDDEQDGGGSGDDDEGEVKEAPSDDARKKSGGRVKASPLARRLADDLGIDLADIDGSGPGGRVVKRDVEEAKEAGVSAPADASSGTSWSPDEDEYEDVAISQMRKTIAKRLVQSLGPIPHFFLTVEVDMGRVVEARTRINAMLEEEDRKVSFNDFVLKAVAAALRKHPNCNAHWLGEKKGIRRFNAVHLGVAVAVEDGLITPVVRNAHRKGIVQISEEVREMAGRARDKKLKPEEYTGATFSVSNLGMFGIQDFTAVINPPEAGILAVGGVEEIPVVEDGEVVIRPRMKITMSCDHRAIDGAQGSRFLRTLTTMLEEPAAILV